MIAKDRRGRPGRSPRIVTAGDGKKKTTKKK